MEQRKIPEHLKLAFAHFCAEIMLEKRQREEGKGRPWTDKEAQRLKEMIDAGVSVYEAAEELNRTPKACHTYYRQRLKGRRPKHNSWTKDQTEILINMRINGYSYREIAKTLGRTEAACRHQISKTRGTL